MEGNACALLSDHYSKYISLSLKRRKKRVFISNIFACVTRQQKNVSKKSTTKHTEEMAIVDDLVLSSDEDVPLNDGIEGDYGEPEED